MKRVIWKITLFVLVPLPILWLVDYVVDTGMHKSRYSYYAVWNDIFGGKINADLVINGSSRAWTAISPRILDTVLHFNTYNIGLDGDDFHLQYETFKIYLRHNRKPKYLIQEVGYVKTLVRYDIPASSDQFLPYLKDTSIWRIVSENYKTFSVFDRYFPLFKYNNEFELMEEGAKSYFGKGEREIKYKGYLPYRSGWTSQFLEFKQSHPNGWIPGISQDCVTEFEEFLDFCSSQSIKVILVYPPAYCEVTAMLDTTVKRKVHSYYDSLSREHGFSFFNYETDSICQSTKYFFNSQHVNKKGAELFSLKFAKDIKELIK